VDFNSVKTPDDSVISKESNQAIDDSYSTVEPVVEPVYTQAMEDAGELPPVGSVCRVNERIGTVKYIGDDVLVIKHVSEEVAYLYCNKLFFELEANL